MLGKTKGDTYLVEGLIKGNISCFDELFEKYSKKLYVFSMNYLKSEADSEEIVQAVFVKIWENRHQLKTELSFKAFIFKVAHNEILKGFRKKAYHQSFVKDQLVQSEINSDDEKRIEYKSILNEVNKLINLLPEKRRVIFIKSRIDGMTSTEIAEQMNIAKSTVDNNLTEALKFLKSKASNLSFNILLFLYLFY